jgi:hypothetical protein
MNFLEKDLETILWESPAECEARGFTMLQMAYFSKGKRFRQMQLGPYGIADLVHIYYNAHSNQAWVHIIECKKDKVNADTYLQARRYVSGVRQAFSLSDLPTCQVNYAVILVGSSVDTAGPLSHAITEDFNCFTYRYSYKVDGIHFEDVSAHWGYESYWEMPGFFDQTVRSVDEYRIMASAANAERLLEEGDADMPLLITSDGVLINTGLLAISNAPR